jgi:hypothetical protein
MLRLTKGKPESSPDRASQNRQREPRPGITEQTEGTQTGHHRTDRGNRVLDTARGGIFSFLWTSPEGGSQGHPLSLKHETDIG